MIITKKVLLLLMLMQLSEQAPQNYMNQGKSTSSKQKQRYKERLSDVKSQWSCIPFTNDETAYNCAAYTMSP
jgi:hypothetical protein